MSHFFRKRVAVHELTFYILTRGLFLTFLFVLAAVAMLEGERTWLATQYAQYLFAMGAVLMGASLIGPLLVEDILRKTK